MTDYDTQLTTTGIRMPGDRGRLTWPGCPAPAVRVSTLGAAPPPPPPSPAEPGTHRYIPAWVKADSHVLLVNIQLQMSITVNKKESHRVKNTSTSEVRTHRQQLLLDTSKKQ